MDSAIICVCFKIYFLVDSHCKTQPKLTELPAGWNRSVS